MKDNLVTAKLTLRYAPNFARDGDKRLESFLKRDERDASTTVFACEDDPGSVEIGVQLDSQDDDEFEDLVWITVTEGELRMMLSMLESMQRLYSPGGCDAEES